MEEHKIPSSSVEQPVPDPVRYTLLFMSAEVFNKLIRPGIASGTGIAGNDAIQNALGTSTHKPNGNGGTVRLLARKIPGSRML